MRACSARVANVPRRVEVEVPETSLEMLVEAAGHASSRDVVAGVEVRRGDVVLNRQRSCRWDEPQMPFPVAVSAERDGLCRGVIVGGPIP